jgi:hypothetical protein
MAQVNVYQSKFFTFNKETRVMAAEASDLQTFATHNMIAIESGKTGNVLIFVHHQTHRNNENEVTHWTYLPTELPSRSPVSKVVIFND